jgi:SAM-dependent methyltransferase
MLFRSRRNRTRDEPQLSFRCNICGRRASVCRTQLGREIPSCKRCGSTVRFRSIVHVLSLELFGESLSLPEFPVRKQIRGLGMSDWDGYAAGFAEKFDYLNTWLHREPKFDITEVPASMEAAFDFVISSDVLEHVPPPISIAFENLHRTLKPEGVLILTVPYTKARETVEHFPELHRYELTESEGGQILTNRTREGVFQRFDDLVFHGGEGATLEMRVFSESSVLSELERAGFAKAKIHHTPDFSHGIYWNESWSLPMSARAR